MKKFNLDIYQYRRYYLHDKLRKNMLVEVRARTKKILVSDSDIHVAMKNKYVIALVIKHDYEFAKQRQLKLEFHE